MRYWRPASDTWRPGACARYSIVSQEVAVICECSFSSTPAHPRQIRWFASNGQFGTFWRPARSGRWPRRSSACVSAIAPCSTHRSESLGQEHESVGITACGTRGTATSYSLQGAIRRNCAHWTEEMRADGYGLISNAASHWVVSCTSERRRGRCLQRGRDSRTPSTVHMQPTHATGMT